MKRAAKDTKDEDRLQRKARIEGSVADAPPVVEPVVTEGPKTDSKTDPQRKAKNFAERLMHVLQGGIGTDTVWWVGEGKAVAIHTRNLKDGDMLNQHFRVKDYGVFIRNCNRWGFRRTVQYPVDQGVIAYQCSLFQRDQPHLVAHMRMDSDVQDVFVRHSESEGADVPFDPRRIGRATYASRGAIGRSRPQGPSERPREPQSRLTNNDLGGTPIQTQVKSGDSPSRGALDGASPLVNTGNLLQSLSVDQLRQLTQGTGLNNLLAASPSQQRVFVADPPLDHGASQAPATHAEGKTHGSEVLHHLLGQVVSSKKVPDPQVPPVAEEQRGETLLNLILTLSEEYLNFSNTNTDACSESIRMALQLLKLQGQKYREEKAKQKQESEAKKSAAGGLIDTLRAHLNRSVSSHAGTAERSYQAERIFQAANLLGTAAAGNAGSAPRIDPSYFSHPTSLVDQLHQHETHTGGDQQGALQQLLSQSQGTTTAARPPSLNILQQYQPLVSAASLLSRLNPDAINQLLQMQNPTQQNR